MAPMPAAPLPAAPPPTPVPQVRARAGRPTIAPTAAAEAARPRLEERRRARRAACDRPVTPSRSGRLPAAAPEAAAAPLDGGRAVVADEPGGLDEDEVSCSQVPMASQEVDAHNFRCSVCLDLLYEPVTTSCRHSFCKRCFYPAIKSAGGAKEVGTSSDEAKRCPLCRAEIGVEVAANMVVDAALWQRVRAMYPERVARRTRQLEAEARANGVSARRARCRSRSIGTSAATRCRAPHAPRGCDARLLPKAEAELQKPESELVRCRCPARYVCIGRVAGASSQFPGRAYHGCPLWVRGRSSGARADCGFLQWEI